MIHSSRVPLPRPFIASLAKNSMWLRTEVSEMPIADKLLAGFVRAAQAVLSRSRTKAEVGFTRAILSDIFLAI